MVLCTDMSLDVSGARHVAVWWCRRGKCAGETTEIDVGTGTRQVEEHKASGAR